MKTKNLIYLLLMSAIPVAAQTTFYSASLPGTIGQYYSAYDSTNNVNVTSMLALTNGPQYWNFSQPQQSNETVLRTDIVSPDDAGDEASFPDATYAERDTREPNDEIAWRYDSLTDEGRVYYGFDEPAESASSLAVFLSPTIDIPASVQFGQTWNRSVQWYTEVLYDFVISNSFSASATVDAYGTLILPSMGPVPALRVHEVDNYESYEIIEGYSPEPVDVNTDQYYYWLVPGIGLAVQITLIGNNTLYSEVLPYTNEVDRVFACNYTNQVVLLPVNGLNIQIQSDTALLSWLQMSNVWQYQVESTTNLNNPCWQLLDLTATNNWSDSFSQSASIEPDGGPLPPGTNTGAAGPFVESQKFFRVFGLQ